MTAAVTASLIEILTVFIIAAGVGIFVAKVGHFPYTIALLIAGFLASLAGIGIDIELTHDIILLVLLPPLLFQGAATTDLEEFRRYLPVILLLAVVGLVGSVMFVSAGVMYAFPALGVGTEFTWLVAVLFAVIILPTDPVSVLALFEELGAPERLAVLVEGESLLNDGVAVVIYAAILELVLSGASIDQVVTAEGLAELSVGILLSSAGGALVGFTAGYAVYSVMVNLDEHMTEIVLTAILAYGSFILAEHYLHVSGVIATVVAGLLMGNRGAKYAMSPQTKLSVFNTWETAAFIVNTFIFVVIGVTTPIGQIIDNAELLVPAILLVLLGRAVTVYPLSNLTNAVSNYDISFEYQHVLVWGGLHASIPIALVLGLPPEVPMREQLRVMVFGIAAFSLVVQGLSMGWVIDRLGIITTTEEERLYQLLVGRARAVNAALEAAETLHEEGRIPTEVYRRFENEYGREKEELGQTISRLLTRHPEIQEQEQLMGEQQVLTRERSAIKGAELDGVLTTDVADELLDEVNIKLDLVRGGESTVVKEADEEGFDEFWRRRAREYDLRGDDVEDEETEE